MGKYVITRCSLKCRSGSTPPPTENVLCLKKRIKRGTGKGRIRKNGENERKIERGRRKERKRAGNSDDKRFMV